MLQLRTAAKGQQLAEIRTDIRKFRPASRELFPFCGRRLHLNVQFSQLLAFQLAGCCRHQIHGPLSFWKRDAIANIVQL